MTWTALLPGLFDLVGKLFPDPAAKAEAQRKLLELQQNGEFRELEKAFEAITTEAKSADPWTSRARPSFLYVIYLMILASIPMGALYAFSPVLAGNMVVGVQTWLNAIPEALWALFGAGYLGYTTARSYDKKKMIEK